tara:strand:+ start:181 stop:288 length:108 start_codon:yes stop_codon:yes gene_type:complete
MLSEEEKDYLFKGVLFVCGIALTFYGLITLLGLFT